MKNSSALLRGRQTAEEILEPTPMTKLRRRVFKNHSFLIGAVILIFIILIALLAPLFSPHDPYDPRAPTNESFLARQKNK